MKVAKTNHLGIVVEQLEPALVESFLWKIRDLLQNRLYFPTLLRWIECILDQKLQVPGPLLEIINEELQALSKESEVFLDSRSSNRLAKCLTILAKRKSHEVTLY